MIITRSMLAAIQSCERRGWLQYLAPNGTGVAGWERRALSMPLATGSYVHKGVEGLLQGKGAVEAVSEAVQGYLTEVEQRGLESDSEGYDDVVSEQSALIDALVLGFERVVLPRLIEEYDVERGLVEQELTVQLADDVTLAARVDWAAPRKADGRWFLFNWKTVSEAGERFMRQWETDLQLVTETLALEQLIGEPVAGVNVIGLVKGQRVGVDERLVEVRGEGKKASRYIQRSKLLYGYKIDPNPPLQPGAYDFESSLKKGWYKFRTWRESFGSATNEAYGHSPLSYWLNWLPQEVVESYFATVPTIWVDSGRRESKVRQVVGMARRAMAGVLALEQDPSEERLDYEFVQNESSCQRFGERHKCPMFDACWTANVSNDLAGSGLFQPRTANHPIEGE